MIRRFRYHELDEYFNIVDAIPKDSPLIKEYYGKDMCKDTKSSDKKLAEISCFASHISAIRKGLSRSHDSKTDVLALPLQGELRLKDISDTGTEVPWYSHKGFVVIEDDVLLHNDFCENFNKVMENVPEDASLVHLSYIVPEWSGMSWSGKDKGLNNLCDLVSGILGTQMYWISVSHALYVLSEFDKNFKDVGNIQTSEAITLSAVNRKGHMSYPILGIEDRQPSLIEDIRNESHIRDFEGWGFHNYNSSEVSDPRVGSDQMVEDKEKSDEKIVTDPVS